jgi:hypothetical protein
MEDESTCKGYKSKSVCVRDYIVSRRFYAMVIFSVLINTPVQK